MSTTYARSPEVNVPVGAGQRSVNKARDGYFGAYRGPMGWACALAAALAYGLATVLQAVGASRVTRADTLDVRLLLRLARSAPYLVGLLLDAAGFLLVLVALRQLPVYVVQSAVSANLAVVAVLAWLLLQVPMQVTDWLWIGAIGAGLILVAMSAAPSGRAALPAGGRWALLAVAVAAAVGSAGVARRPVGTGPVLGVVAGAEFGVVALAARVLPSTLEPARLAVDPASWALLTAGAAGTLVYATALQRGPLTATSAAVVATETVGPAAVAAVVLGDLPRSGWLLPAVAGVALVVTGAVRLAVREASGLLR